MKSLLVHIVIGLVGTVWIYVLARLVTRAITRTLDERRRENNGETKEEEK